MKIAGLITGLGFIALGIFWGNTPDSHSYLLFFTGILFIVGSTHTVTNQEDTR